MSMGLMELVILVSLLALVATPVLAVTLLLVMSRRGQQQEAK
jgi:hypothetical protein